jgi:large subunit ribosomal protein L10
MAKVSKKPVKEKQVGLLTEKLKSARVVVLTDYRGLTVAQLQDLRAKLRSQEVEYRITKNTLARRAAKEAGHDELAPELEGPIAMAFGYEDLSAPAKLLNEWARTTRLKLDIKGGMVEGRVYGPDQIKQLAELPPREVLIAQLLGTLQSPVAQLVATIQAPVSQLVGLLESYKSKLEAA